MDLYSVFGLQVALDKPCFVSILIFTFSEDSLMAILQQFYHWRYEIAIQGMKMERRLLNLRCSRLGNQGYMFGNE